jgi:hypothetical protein
MLDVEEAEDEEYEAMLAAAKALPPRTQEEIDQEIDDFCNHPLNVKKITPEMLERPEYQALQALAYEGTPDEVGQNFVQCGMDNL